jgi:hypothetical protein
MTIKKNEKTFLLLKFIGNVLLIRFPRQFFKSMIVPIIIFRLKKLIYERQNFKKKN